MRNSGRGLNVGTVLLRVSNLDRAATFYGEVLDLHETSRNEGSFVFFHAGSVTIALHRVGADGADPKSLHGLTEIAFDVSDIRGEFDRLRAAGVDFLCGTQPILASSDATHDLYAAPFRDPDGHLLSLTSRVPRSG